MWPSKFWIIIYIIKVKKSASEINACSKACDSGKILNLMFAPSLWENILKSLLRFLKGFHYQSARKNI